jgi:hypothetical protein
MALLWKTYRRIFLLSKFVDEFLGYLRRIFVTFTRQMATDALFAAADSVGLFIIADGNPSLKI